MVRRLLSVFLCAVLSLSADLPASRVIAAQDGIEGVNSRTRECILQHCDMVDCLLLESALLIRLGSFDRA